MKQEVSNPKYMYCLTLFFFKEKKYCPAFSVLHMYIYSITNRLGSTPKARKKEKLFCVGVYVYEKKQSTLFDLFSFQPFVISHILLLIYIKIEK
jgi:hypothetical protein